MPAEAFVGGEGATPLEELWQKQDYSGPNTTATIHTAKGSSSSFSRIWFWCGVLEFSVVKGEFWELSKRPICAGRQCLVSPKSSLCLSKAPTKGTTWLPETTCPGHLERGDNQKPPEIGCGQTSGIPAPLFPTFT